MTFQDLLKSHKPSE